MATTDTIAAIASGPGASPRAIIRLSGPDLAPLLADLCSPPPPPTAPSRALFATSLRLDPGDPSSPSPPTLPVLLLRYPPGNSFTGDDSAEILLPGNPHLLERITAAIAARPGVRHATPGEFSARAFLRGRLGIDQAEGIAATIAAQTDDDLAAAARLASGQTGRDHRARADELATLLALVEAGIDFTDQEDVVPIPPADLARRLAALDAQIAAALGARRAREVAAAAPTVVLAGRPNAGKSTLFNALLGRRRAVVSDVPGATRDAIAEPLDLSSALPGGPTVTLIDLAGIDEPLPGADAALADIDLAAQRRARDLIADADAVVYCDPTGRFADPAIAALRPGRPLIRVRTKADQPAPGAAHADGDALPVCALDGFNLGPLRRAIADATWSARTAGAAAAVLPRHRRALAAAAARIADAAALIAPSAESGAPLPAPELVAGALREALDALGELTGRISPDDVIGRIFATFCVGK